MWPSLSDMLSIANVRAVRVISSARALASCLATEFQPWCGAWAAKSLATSASCEGRSVLSAAPTATTSSKSLAYLPPVISGGGSTRNCAELSTPNGFTNCQCRNRPRLLAGALAQLGVGCHSYGAVLAGVWNKGVCEPSLLRFAI